jgi:hypothetical protein
MDIEKIMNAVKTVSEACATPEDFAVFCDQLAARLYVDRCDLQSAHQDKTAGAVWGKAAGRLEAIATIVCED